MKRKLKEAMYATQITQLLGDRARDWTPDHSTLELSAPPFSLQEKTNNKQNPTKFASPKMGERHNSRNSKVIFMKNSLVLIFLISLWTGESFVKGLLWPADLHSGILAPSLQQQKSFKSTAQVTF